MRPRAPRGSSPAPGVGHGPPRAGGGPGGPSKGMVRGGGRAMPGPNDHLGEGRLPCTQLFQLFEGLGIRSEAPQNGWGLQLDPRSDPPVFPPGRTLQLPWGPGEGTGGFGARTITYHLLAHIRRSRHQQPFGHTCTVSVLEAWDLRWTCNIPIHQPEPNRRKWRGRFQWRDDDENAERGGGWEGPPKRMRGG